MWRVVKSAAWKEDWWVEYWAAQRAVHWGVRTAVHLVEKTVEH